MDIIGPSEASSSTDLRRDSEMPPGVNNPRRILVQQRAVSLKKFCNESFATAILLLAFVLHQTKRVRLDQQVQAISYASFSKRFGRIAASRMHNTLYAKLELRFKAAVRQQAQLLFVVSSALSSLTFFKSLHQSSNFSSNVFLNIHFTVLASIPPITSQVRTSQFLSSITMIS